MRVQGMSTETFSGRVILGPPRSREFTLLQRAAKFHPTRGQRRDC